MFPFNHLKKAQLEISSRCQAACPMCSRNIRGGGTNERLKINDWTLSDYKKILSDKVLRQLTYINFCGTYGDPIMNNDLLDMVKHSYDINPYIALNISTNGSARSVSWWKELAKVSKNKNLTVVFGIDGLRDTHTLYRINTDFDKILNNAQAFINGGGNATWQFILFKHNEHQIEAAQALSKEYGFKQFTLIDTYRFVIEGKFDVYDNSGNITHTLEKSAKSDIDNFPQEYILRYKEILNSVDIECEAKRDKAIYIDANYHLYPCCYIAGTMYNSYNYWEPLPGPKEVASAWRQGHLDILDQNQKMVSDMGGFDYLDLTKNSLEDILDAPTYGEVWESQWTGCNKNYQCAGICAKKSTWSTSSNQVNIKQL